MLPASRQTILSRLAEDDKVLDVGGWADPFGRADWVLDVMPFETRGLYAREGWAPAREEPERFSAETWVTRDICRREPWPFEDREFDFAICSHTLEDVRDPLWVCSELTRVARAGYVEVPSRLEEQSFSVAGAFAGWPHHHWLIDVEGDSVQFVFKTHAIHSDPRYSFPSGFVDALSPEERVSTLWWEGSFDFSERLFVDEPLDAFLSEPVRREMERRGVRRAGPLGRISRRLRRGGS